MKLSVFKKCKALPSKEEKASEARFTSKPYLPEVVEFETTEELIEIITTSSWSPSIFKEYRRQDGFISTDLIVLDIDDGMLIEEAENIVHKLDIATLCIPSTSFSEDLHRYRLIFPLARTITDKESFSATMLKVAEYFPADPACLSDSSRFFFGGKLVDGFWYDSKLLEPVRSEKPRNSPVKAYDSKEVVTVGESIEELVEFLFKEKRDTIPENIAYWLENAHTGLSGEWHNYCNSALFTLGLMNVNFDIVETVFRQIAPEELDDKDERLLNKAWNDGYNSRSGEKL